MTPLRLGSRPRIILDLALGVVAITTVAIVSGHPAVAEVMGGASILWFSVLAGTRLARRLVDEIDPTTVLTIDLLLVLVVICGLVGVGVVGAAIP